MGWFRCAGIMILKVDNPVADQIGDFRQIALLNVEGKIFWSMVADRQLFGHSKFFCLLENSEGINAQGCRLLGAHCYDVVCS